MGCRLTPLWMPAPPVLASPALGGVRQAHGTGSVTARWPSAPRVARKGGHSRRVEPLRAVSEAAPLDLRSWGFSGSWPGTWALGHLLRCTVSLVRWTTAIPSSPGAGPSDRVKPEALSAGPWVTASDWPGLPRAPLGSGAFSGACGVQAVSPSSQEIPWGHRALHSSGHTGPGPHPASRWWTCSPRTTQAPRGALPSQTSASQALLPSSQACLKHLLPRGPDVNSGQPHVLVPPHITLPPPRSLARSHRRPHSQPRAPGRCGRAPPPPGRGSVSSETQRLR